MEHNKCEQYINLINELDKYKDNKLIKNYYLVFFEDIHLCKNMNSIFDKYFTNLFIENKNK